jgi:hypothetical protein
MKCALTIVAGVGLVTLAGCETPPTYRALMQDILLEADYWEDEPRILAVGLGFTDVNGTPGVSLPLDLAEFAVPMSIPTTFRCVHTRRRSVRSACGWVSVCPRFTVTVRRWN